MHCMPKYQIGLLGSGFFFAIVDRCLVLPTLADKIGRKKIFTGGILLHTIVIALLLTICHSLIFAFVLLMFIGVAACAKAYVGYVYLLEMMPKTHQVFVGTFIFVVDALCLTFIS